MINYTLTKHAQTRLPQRNLSQKDIDLVLSYGTETRDGVMLMKRDVYREIKHLKRMIKRIERLKDTFVVIDGGSLITSYRPGPQKMKHVLRSIETQNLGAV